MKTINNRDDILKEDLSEEIAKGSRLSIAAACFSIYAYKELKAELDRIEQLRFVFTSPTFVKEKIPREKREFYIPRLNRERNLYGSEFEVKLRNELTQKAIAKECADWIRKKVAFKSNISQERINGFINVQNNDKAASYMPINGFTTVDLGCDKGNNAYNIIVKTENSESLAWINTFERIWNDESMMQEVTEQVIESITTVYNENSPEFIYFVTLYNIFNEFLEDISEDVLPNEATGFKESYIWKMLYHFQQDAALAIINKLEKYNGCILADSVGLGKTFTSLAVIKYYENRNKSVLVLCPKKLMDNWNTYKDNYINNPIAKDRLNYDVLFHTDLSRIKGISNGLDLGRLNWGNYDLVVIDESHNFRNGGELSGKDNEKENRYLRLLNKVIRSGVRTKVLMLSATPVNNRFNDLKNQLAIAYEGEQEQLSRKLDITKSIDEIFKQAQRAFTLWSKLRIEDRTTDRLLKMLDIDFFEVLDSVTIARSRKHIEEYYNMDEVGTFPERLQPISLRPKLTELKTAINYNEIYENLMQLNLNIYTPTDYVFASKLDQYIDTEKNINQQGREQGIRRLMSINLLKRLESSVYAFRLTVGKVLAYIKQTVDIIDAYENGNKGTWEFMDVQADEDFDFDDQNKDVFAIGKKVKIDLADMDYVSWRKKLTEDIEQLELLDLMIRDITPEHDFKLQTLFKTLSNKIENPINAGNQKVLVFTAFADTANYLYEHVSKFVKEKYGLDSAMITGAVDGRTTIPKFSASFHNVLTCFSPLSKDKEVLMPHSKEDITVLIATDCVSEGQNLQDCDYCINYDIHWNPVRIIQRFGRIDRIGSQNKWIQLVNFWPDIDLDDYINLKERVEARMKAAVMTSTGDDDLINVEEKGDLEYRKAQLERLQKEVVDIEDMTSGVSIMDLGLNEFRLDLIEYSKTHENLDSVPFGMHAVVSGEKPGVVFVLRNVNSNISIVSKNRLHPFYMVYIGEDGEIISNHLNPKHTLDLCRKMARGKAVPEKELCKIFNKETKDGHDMRRTSQLLKEAVVSIVAKKEEDEMDSFFAGKDVSFLSENIRGMDDFELIAFFVVK